MSAEPGRKAAYSSDLRWRIIWQRFGMQLCFRKVAENLNISPGTVYNICKLFEATGSVNPKIAICEDKRLFDGQQELYIMGMVVDNPSLYLGELCQKVSQLLHITASPSTICRLIYRHGFSRKRMQLVAYQRSSEYRAAFMAAVLMFSCDKFVWIDETGCDRRDHIRKLGYALQGERPVCRRVLHRGQRISIITALTTGGVIATEIIKGTVDGAKFTNFVQGKLIPEMMPFDGDNPRSIAILDNCSVHHVAEVESSLKQAGILVYYLPPYSPDLNPAEELFSYFKYYLKLHDEVLQAMEDPVPLIQDAFDNISVQNCLGWIGNSGYM